MESSSSPPSPERLLEHVAWLRRLAGTLVLDAARADDVTQQTLLEALQRAPARVDHPRAWLATVARNVARSWSRGDARRQSLERATAHPESEPAADEVVARTAQHHQVVGAVLALAEPYRTTVLLRFFENQKPGAIAKRTGVPVETVRTRLKRGLELLRAELVQRKGSGAFALVGLIDPGMRAAATKLVLGGTVAGGVVGGVAMSVKAKVAIGVAVVACAVVAVVETRSSMSRSGRSGASDVAARGAAANGAMDGLTTSTEATRASASGGAPAPDRAKIRVRVTDRDGAPIEGAHVGVLVPEPARTLEERERPPSPFEFVAGSTATTSETGECVVPLRAVAGPPLVDLAATADGYVPAFWQRARGGDSISLTLEKGGTLRGVVRDLEGTPIEGAVVATVLDARRQLRVETRSGKDGRYELAPFVGVELQLERFRPGSVWITVRADGFAPVDLPAIGNARESGERLWTFDAWLGHGATVRGRVVDRANGSPIGGADVWIPLMIRRRAEIELRTRSATDGSFAFEHVPAWGVHAIGASGWAGMERALLGSLCASVNGGGRDQFALDVPEEGEELSFELRLGETGGVRGRVVDPLGRPIAGVLVTPAGLPSVLWWERGDLGSKRVDRTITDDEGRYELRDLLISNGAATTVPINAEIEFNLGWSVATTNRLVPLEAGRIVDAEDLVLRLPDITVIRVFDESGNGVPDAIVQRWRFDGRGRKLRDDPMRSGATGRCFFVDDRSLVAQTSRASITVDAVGFAFLERKVEPGETAIDLRLAPEHHLHGRILDVDGKPGAARVFAVSATEAAERFAAALRSDQYDKGPHSETAFDDATAGSGRFTVRGLGAGPWHVAAVRRFDARTPTVVVVANVRDESSDVEIVFPRSTEPFYSPSAEMEKAAGYGNVELQLTLADSGRPAFRGGSATLERDGERGFQARAIAPGRYLFEHVPAGIWDLRLYLPGAASSSRPVAVEADRATTLAIAVPASLEARGKIAVADLPPFHEAQVHLESDDGGGSLAGRMESDGTYRVSGLAAASRYRFWLELFQPDGTRRSWAAEGESRPSHEWSGATPRLVPAGELVLRFDNGPNRERLVVRVLDAHGGERMVVHPGRFEIEHAECLELGTYTIRVEADGEPARERKLTLDPEHRNFVTVWLGGIEVR